MDKLEVIVSPCSNHQIL